MNDVLLPKFLRDLANDLTQGDPVTAARCIVAAKRIEALEAALCEAVNAMEDWDLWDKHTTLIQRLADVRDSKHSGSV